MGLLPEIKNRFSVRHFKNVPLDPEKLSRILEAGRLAPSAKNRQPWRFLVVDDPEIKSRLTSAAYGQQHVLSAGAVIVACSTNIEYIMPNGQPAYPIDITFAVSFMMLQAEKEGYGSCIVTMFNESEVHNILTLPYSMKAVMMLAVGEKDEEPVHTDRKSTSQVVSFNHW
ncbi:MAG: nitroreductase family protein [Spirochaetia bacterium]|nr:nitroreductase family protein [Spirochaetia bacterium]MBQ3713291.1 nitroreductase family protein [Spirochaetia bacterium]MBR0317786.1 nitroreductase family protein [Spirochaetia bacterium]